MVAPAPPTCGDRIYDCYVVSTALAALGPAAAVRRAATTRPRVPVRLSYDRLGPQARARVLKTPRPFDVKTEVDADRRDAAAAAASEAERHAPLIDQDGSPDAAARDF